MEHYQRIDSVYAYLSVDEEGNEGILGTVLPNGKIISLVTGDYEVMKKMRVIAEDAARSAGTSVVLAKYSSKEIVDTIEVLQH